MPCIICGAPATKVLRCKGCAKVAGAVCDGAVCQPSLWRLGRHEPRSVVALLNLECASCAQPLETVRRRTVGVAAVRSVGAGPSVVRSVGAGPSVVRSGGAGPVLVKKEPVDRFAAAAERRRAFERMISTLTLVYPLGTRSSLDASAKKALMAGLLRLLKPGGRLYVDTADSARIMKPFLPEGASLVPCGKSSGLSYVARPT